MFKIINHFISIYYDFNFRFSCNLLQTICVKTYLNQILEVQLQRIAEPLQINCILKISKQN